MTGIMPKFRHLTYALSAIVIGVDGCNNNCYLEVLVSKGLQPFKKCVDNSNDWLVRKNKKHRQNNGVFRYLDLFNPHIASFYKALMPR